MKGEIGIHKKKKSYAWENIPDSVYLTDDEPTAGRMN